MVGRSFLLPLSESKANYMTLCRTMAAVSNHHPAYFHWDQEGAKTVEGAKYKCGRYRCFHLRGKNPKDYSDCTFRTPSKRKTHLSQLFFPHLKEKDLRVLVLYLHAKAKAYPTRFESIVYSVQSQGLLWRKADTERKSSSNRLQEAREQWEETASEAICS